MSITIGRAEWYHARSPLMPGPQPTYSRYSAIALSSLVIWFASGCLPPLVGAPCTSDADCSGGECTRTNECTDSAISVRISWTFFDVQPSEQVCADRGISGLRVTFEDSANFDSLSYEPVSCAQGQILFDSMPRRFDSVEVSVRNGSRVLDRARRSLQNTENTIEIDFQP